jgi:hypothetical protein
MPQKTDYLAETGIVVITYSGRVTIAEVREATIAAIAIQQHRQTDRVLIDATVMTAWPSLVDMWHLIESYPQLQVPPRTRLAALRPSLPDNKDISGFFEVTCQNRAYNARAFHDRRDAEEWLRLDGSR